MEPKYYLILILVFLFILRVVKNVRRVRKMDFYIKGFDEHPLKDSQDYALLYSLMTLRSTGITDMNEELVAFIGSIKIKDLGFWVPFIDEAEQGVKSTAMISLRYYIIRKG